MNNICSVCFPVTDAHPVGIIRIDSFDTGERYGTIGYGVGEPLNDDGQSDIYTKCLKTHTKSLNLSSNKYYTIVIDSAFHRGGSFLLASYIAHLLSYRQCLISISDIDNNNQTIVWASGTIDGCHIAIDKLDNKLENSLNFFKKYQDRLQLYIATDSGKSKPVVEAFFKKHKLKIKHIKYVNDTQDITKQLGTEKTYKKTKPIVIIALITIILSAMLWHNPSAINQVITTFNKLKNQVVEDKIIITNASITLTKTPISKATNTYVKIVNTSSKTIIINNEPQLSLYTLSTPKNNSCASIYFNKILPVITQIPISSVIITPKTKQLCAIRWQLSKSNKQVITLSVNIIKDSNNVIKNAKLILNQALNKAWQKNINLPRFSSDIQYQLTIEKNNKTTKITHHIK